MDNTTEARIAGTLYWIALAPLPLPGPGPLDPELPVIFSGVMVMPTSLHALTTPVGQVSPTQWTKL
jgi:hypothetical protein